jgi:hypothetical protein
VWLDIEYAISRKHFGPDVNESLLPEQGSACCCCLLLGLPCHVTMSLLSSRRMSVSISCSYRPQGTCCHSLHARSLLCRGAGACAAWLGFAFGKPASVCVGQPPHVPWLQAPAAAR